MFQRHRLSGGDRFGPQMRHLGRRLHAGINRALEAVFLLSGPTCARASTCLLVGLSCLMPKHVRARRQGLERSGGFEQPPQLPPNARQGMCIEWSATGQLARKDVATMKQTSCCYTTANRSWTCAWVSEVPLYIQH